MEKVNWEEVRINAAINAMNAILSGSLRMLLFQFIFSRTDYSVSLPALMNIFAVPSSIAPVLTGHFFTISSQAQSWK